MSVEPELARATDQRFAGEQGVFERQLRLTDGRLAVLLTEYAELSERFVEQERACEGEEPGTPPRSHSLVHYLSRQVEDLEPRLCRAVRLGRHSLHSV